MKEGRQEGRNEGRKEAGTNAPSYHFLWCFTFDSVFLTVRVVREKADKIWVWLKGKREKRKPVSLLGLMGAGKPAHQGCSEQVAAAPGHFKH